MLQHIYGKPLDAASSGVSEEGWLDHLFDVYDIANEYQIPSLGEAITERVVQLMQTCPIDSRHNTFFTAYDNNDIARGRKMFSTIMSRTADLYINNNVADKTLMNGVLNTCFAMVRNLPWLEQNLDISSLIGQHDPFCGRLLQLYLPTLQLMN